MELVSKDRIGGLPDCLILHILSLLPTKISATTSTLSKQWQFLWTFVPVLDFPADSSSDMTITSFVSFVHRSIILNQSLSIDKFRLHFRFSEALTMDVHVWLRFAIRKNVKQLDLDFSNAHDQIYDFPVHMFANNPSLESLKLKELQIDHGIIINWKSLKVLSLHDIPTDDDFLDTVFPASPALQLLELIGCFTNTYLHLKSETLRKIVMHDCDFTFVSNQPTPGSYQPTPLKITAPSLQTLHITGDLYDFTIINPSSLLDVELDFDDSLNLSLNSNKYTTILVKLLGSLRHVKKLTLGSCCLQALSLYSEKALPCLLSTWVRLYHDTSLSDNELPGMARLLAQTHLLETLIIDVEECLSSVQLETTRFLKPYDPGEENYWSTHQSSSALLHLKTVRIVGFLATKHEVEFLLFLLQKAPKLETMIINPHNTAMVSLKEVAQILLKFPRAARDAVVLFC